MAYLTIHRFRPGNLPDAALKERHAAFLRENAARLIAFGPVGPEGAPVGFVTYADVADDAAAKAFREADPLTAVAGETVVRGWASRLKKVQAGTPERPGLKGFFMWGDATSDGPKRREAILPAHQAYFHPYDDTNFVAKGPIVTTDGTAAWRGTSFAIEFPDRPTFEKFFAEEPFNKNGLFRSVEVLDWRRGAL